MTQAVLRVEHLPDAALDAAVAFHCEWVARIRAEDAASLVVVLPPAPYDHAGWRLAAARDLARACAPRRINFTTHGSGDALASALAYLAAAPGVTGQYLPLAD